MDLSHFLRQSEGGLFVDAGANVGEFAALAMRLFPAGRVLCFEPDPRAFMQLERRFVNQRQVELFPVALGARDGRARLQQAQESVGSSLLLFDTEAAPAGLHGAGWLSPAGSTEVNVRSLDSLLAERGNDQLDLLKLDVQGLELEVLRGAERLIREQRVKAVMCELLGDSLYRGQASYLDVMAFLEKAGYGIVGMYNVARNTMGCMSWCDALFLPRRPAKV